MTVLKLVNLLIPLVARMPAAEVKLSNTNVDWTTADIEGVYDFKNTVYIEVINRDSNAIIPPKTELG
jgi:hypothetical protein